MVMVWNRWFTAGPSTAPNAADALVVGPLALFACFGVWAELHYATHAYPWAPGAYLLVAAGAVPLLWRRRRPVPAAGLCLAAVAAYHFAGYPGLAPGVLVFLACAGLGLYCERRGLLYALSAAAVVWILPTLPPDSLDWYALDVSMPALAYGATAVVADSARRRRLEHDARLKEEAAAAEDRLSRRLIEERLRIARELHDVLAHTISVVTVQSNVALDALAASPPETGGAREAMLLVRGAARQAMPELRAAVDLLLGRDAPPDARPQPSLGQLDELAARFRTSGLDVELNLPAPDVRTLTPLVQLTAYRITQEALTNTLRHAEATHATVTMTRAGDTVLLQIEDDGTAAAAAGTAGGSASAGGFGLLGMAQRAEALGGRVEAGPRAAGGWLVRAELPWETL